MQWVKIMENEIIVKRNLYLKILMSVFTVVTLAASILLFILTIKTEGTGKEKVVYVTVRGALLSAVFLLLFLLSSFYTYALFAWRIRIAENSVFVRTWTTAEVEYKKEDIVVSNLKKDTYLPNDGDSQPLGAHYVIWLKVTKQQITDVYGRDKNSKYISDMCSK